VTGAVLGWVILGQSLSPIQLAGFVITIAAIAYGTSLGAAPPRARITAERAAVLPAGQRTGTLCA
jgi:threonine/homoserine efflux transporter RhtA